MRRVGAAAIGHAVKCAADGFPWRNTFGALLCESVLSWHASELALVCLRVLYKASQAQESHDYEKR